MRACVAGKLLLAVAAFVAGAWRGWSFDAAHRCGEPPAEPRGVVVEVRAKAYGDRALARGEGGWGFVANVGSGQVAVGDRIALAGARVAPIEDFVGESGQAFPYADLMRSRGFCFEARGGEVAVMGESREPLDLARQVGAAARSRIARVLPPEAATLSAGALLGGDEGLDGELETAAQRAGLSHALALSGFNVAVFAGAVDLSLRRLAPRRARILGGALAGWILVAVAGLPASGVRAALAWSVGSLARILFRRAEAPRALLYATFAFAWSNPLAIAFDLSLQLSVLACLGIAAWATPVAEKLVGVPGVPTVREAAAATVAATAATLPVSAWVFGQVSLVGPIANALVAYAVPAMMWAGLAAALAPPWGPLSSALSLPADLFAWVARAAGNWPWSAYPISLSAAAALAGSLAVALAALVSVWLARRRERKIWEPEIARLERALRETS